MVKKIFISIVLICITFMGCSDSKTVSSNSIQNSNGNNKKIELYIPDSNLLKWNIQEETIDISDLKNIIEALKESGKCCIPIDTTVNSIEVINKIAYIDLSAEFDDNQTSSSAACKVKIYSIVNTLCLNKELNIEGVKFLLAGEETDTIGPMDVSIIKTPKLEL